MPFPTKITIKSKSAQPSPQKKRVYVHFESWGKGITKFWRHATSPYLKRLWRGNVNEEKKAVLQRGLKRVLFRCLIHLSAVSATTALAYFNLAGYFIGDELQGLSGGVYQDLDTLCLQVTAKLLVMKFCLAQNSVAYVEQELLVVASLGMILMDILRQHLLFEQKGLPLGILASKQRFTEMQYLLSPEFRFGLAGFARRRKRALVGLFIFTSSLISLFAGPSAALLLVPTRRSDWPAGGASFSLAGDDNSLWPSKLTSSSLGGPGCMNPGIKELSVEALNSSGCIWAGYSTLAEAFKQRHFNSDIYPVVDDGILNRAFVIRPRGKVAETWVLAVHVAVGVLAKIAAEAWYEALQGISVSSWRHTLLYRTRNGTVGYVQSWVPAVRTVCNCNTTSHISEYDGSSLLLNVCSCDLNLYPFLDHT